MNGQSVQRDLLKNVIIKMPHVLTQEAMPLLDEELPKEVKSANMARTKPSQVE